MKWEKKSFICSQETLDIPWYKKNSMVPVPYLVAPDRLRLFLTMCDADNVGRIGYVDVNPENPSEILGYSKEPVLDIGEDGCFDDSGVLPSALYEHEGKLYMFYSAYQKHVKVPYSILSGLAVFEGDDYSKLTRISNSPILERTQQEQFIRSAIYCIKAQGKHRIYYSSGNAWIHNQVKEAPRYDIKAIETDDLFNWHGAEPQPCLELAGDEYGLTTPGVYQEDGLYKMIYAIRSISKGYRIGYAESKDGFDWTRMDDHMDIDVSKSGWDSEMICFANMYRYNDKTYLFYCGNHYGIGGMGYAELVK